MTEEFQQHIKNLDKAKEGKLPLRIVPAFMPYFVPKFVPFITTFLTDPKKAEEEAKAQAEEDEEDDIGPWLKCLRHWASHLDPDFDMAKRYRQFILETRFPDRG